jgi:hypothetical protein
MFSPPLIISRAQIDEMVTIFGLCLDLTQQSLAEAAYTKQT